MTRLHGCMVALVVGVAACSGHTEAGPIGKPLDLRLFIPTSLRSANPGRHDSTYRQQIPVGPDSARVEVTWTSYAHDSGSYLATVSARLVAPARYDSLLFGNISAVQNVGTKIRPVESVNAQVAWFKRALFGKRSGVMNFGFDAAGRRTVGPAADR